MYNLKRVGLMRPWIKRFPNKDIHYKKVKCVLNHLPIKYIGTRHEFLKQFDIKLLL